MARSDQASRLRHDVRQTHHAPANAQAIADDYPQRTVTFVCPFPAGGGTDILTRVLAQELQEKLKRPVVVENRPGAGTVIAANAVAQSPPDGNKQLLAPVTTHAHGPSIASFATTSSHIRRSCEDPLGML